MTFEHARYGERVNAVRTDEYIAFRHVWSDDKRERSYVLSSRNANWSDFLRSVEVNSPVLIRVWTWMRIWEFFLGFLLRKCTHSQRRMDCFLKNFHMWKNNRKFKLVPTQFFLYGVILGYPIHVLSNWKQGRQRKIRWVEFIQHIDYSMLLYKRCGRIYVRNGG